jgi:hypothetical protein
LVCDKCREKFDFIFYDPINSDLSERVALNKWLGELCDDCRKILIREGYIKRKRRSKSATNKNTKLKKSSGKSKSIKHQT